MQSITAAIVLAIGLSAAFIGGIQLATGNDVTDSGLSEAQAEAKKVQAQKAQAKNVLAEMGGVSVFQGLPVSDLTFIDENGRDIELSSLRGHRSLLFFGYTYCPDVCPVTLMYLGKAWNQLSAEQQSQWRVVMVSVDPERDKGAPLKQYMDHFHPQFTALTGRPDSLRSITTEVQGFYGRVQREDGGYLLDHSANLVVLDAALNYRGYIEPPHTPERLQKIMEQLSVLMPLPAEPSPLAARQ